MSPLPPLSRLRPFDAAARYESFSRAADELGMTQAAVSKQISMLESELGVLLFDRKNRAVFLTEPGRRLARVVGAALSDVSAEIAAITGTRRSNEVVLHCQLCEAFFWLMPRLSGFHQQHPEVELRVVSTLAPIVEAKEEFDVAIQTSGRASGSARLVLSAEDEVFPVCAPNLLKQQRLPIGASDLRHYPLLAHDVTPQDWMDWSDWFDRIGLKLEAEQKIIPFNSYPLALQSAVAGHGIALGWKRTTEKMIAEGKLLRPCTEFVHRPAELLVFLGRTRQLHPGTDKLLEWLAEELAA